MWCYYFRTWNLVLNYKPSLLASNFTITLYDNSTIRKIPLGAEQKNLVDEYPAFGFYEGHVIDIINSKVILHIEDGNYLQCTSFSARIFTELWSTFIIEVCILIIFQSKL